LEEPQVNLTDETVRAVGGDLRALGYDVAVDDRGLQIRLSFFCSVWVHVHDGGVKLRPMFGLVSRTSGNWMTIVGALLTLLFMFSYPTDSHLLQWGCVFLAMVAALVFNVYRFVLTESAASCVRYLLVAKYSK
jgi:hypothetical protein